MWQGNHVPGDSNTQAALSNGQVFLQKTDGWFQFYVQAGAYNIPALGIPFLDTDKTISRTLWPGARSLSEVSGGQEHVHSRSVRCPP